MNPANPTGTWYVLCRREHLIPLDQLADRFSGLNDTRITEVDVDYLALEVDDSLTGNRAGIRVFVDDEPHVHAQARDLARLFAARPDHDAIAAAEVRYAIGWELPFSDETYNQRSVIAEVLARATHGIVYDLTEGRMVWSALVDDDELQGKDDET